MIAPHTGKAFAVLFQEVERWDPSSFHKIRWEWPQNVMKPISTFLTSRKIKVDRDAVTFSDLQPITIHLDGSIDKRKVAGDREYSMELFYAHPGDIIVAKIDLKNGAVGIAPNWPNIAVTNHFAVYEPKLNTIVPEYFHLLIQTSFFRAHLWRNKVGAEGRKEVKLGFFETEQIPVPSIKIQRSIVRHWNVALTKVEDARTAITNPVSKLNDALFKLYGREASNDVMYSRFFALDFKDLDAWDAKSGRASAFRLACPSFRPMGNFIEDVTEMVRPFEDPKKEWPVYGVNNKDGVFLNSHQKGESFNAPYKRIQKDWFFHNPTRCNVGSLGKVPEVPEDAITSPEYQVWRLKKGLSEPLLPEYLAILIQTPFFLELVQFNRVGAVKQPHVHREPVQVTDSVSTTR